MNIEVDGKQHYQNANQIVADLKRTHYSDLRGYDTIHIPNVFLDDDEDHRKIADALAKATDIRAQKLGHRLPYRHYSGKAV